MSKSLWGAPVTTEPTPFDEITPEMLEGAGKAPETPARYEMRCGHCSTTIHIGHETDPEEVFGEDLDRNVCVSCSENLDGVTVRQLQPDVRWATCVVQDCPSPSDAAIMKRLTKLTREHWAWNGEPVRMLAATDPPTLRDITTSELETMGLRLRASQPEPPPTGNGELVTPPLVEALEGHPDLQALVNERDAFGRSKYGTGLRCHNGRDPLEDARQELGDLLQYLWQAMMEGRDITSALDQMARALSVLQERKR